uniref:COX assembly mitochondrial protein n=1 Tax=Chaetoceros debilis TaxID=122233 RepID=A0A7S3QIY3_9STRA|mmetsp:Transcript_29592/g.45182  ORF Transcript_29592/g.45182 Transcript_29592/m.45182 type:complete len:116 (+) Transcript_29592:125-472(+)|eukprot:CAMPEP_0194114532 /NCGR_PEP_ID=MMETSP0150-20130528/20514_1 /TAXON_ID=122233 /ORGANISM="Chaetoceros debilis, Strain MM31A-1" /LENGTH=115 /DNA_ID=CAMNT_0038804761 /DNA_START=76 /DNA_END=423 /DNA_ORIENTATION=-
MHPPLDRPHPMCQSQIDALRTCHATTSKLKFWACNEVKFQMDACFKEEKQELLKQMNSDFEEKREREDVALREAMGKTQTFEEFLKTDKTYLKDLKDMKDNPSETARKYKQTANS